MVFIKRKNFKVCINQFFSITLKCCYKYGSSLCSYQKIQFQEACFLQLCMTDDFLSSQPIEVHFSFICRHSTPLLMIYLPLSSLCQHLIGWRALEMMSCSWSTFTKDGMPFFHIHQSFYNAVDGCSLIAVKIYEIVWDRL